VKELEKLLGMWNESLSTRSVLAPRYVLGLAPDASMEEAKARYKVLMRFWHTDICKLPMPWKCSTRLNDAMERFQSKPSVSESFKGQYNVDPKTKPQPIKRTV